MFNVAIQVGSKILPHLLRASSRYGVKSALRRPSNVKYISSRYGKLSPLAKRSVESFGSGVVSSYLMTGFDKKYISRSNIKKYNFGKSMPYGYARRPTYRRSYSRYSRPPMYRRRYTSYRRRY